MTEFIATYDGRIAKVQGPARSGKTEALVRRCAFLVQQGAAPSSILVEVSGACASQAFRHRLRAALDSSLAQAADAIRVSCALDICTHILASPHAITATGRIPRLLNTAEYNFFLEDMKTLGQPIRRLRAMLDHFYAQWSKLEPKDAWLLSGEEETVYAHLVDTLSHRGAMLPQEAPAICARYLQSPAGAEVRHSFDYVLCDDFQNMSYAEQTCMCLLAGKQIIVCGNPNQTTALHTAYPHAEGFVRFDTTRRGVDVFELETAYGNPAVTAFANALCEHGDMDPTLRANRAEGISSDIISIKWSTPEDEFNGITKYIRILLDAEEDTHGHHTCVLVPNKRWARMLETVLRQRGFTLSTAGACTTLSGDPRVSSRAGALVAYTKLNLLADPHDMVAWRSWCGFDNHLTNSDAWSGLEKFALAHGMTLYGALAQIGSTDDEPFLRASTLAQRWKSGQDFIAQNAQRRGFALLRALDADGLAEFEEAARIIEGDEDASTLYRIERACMMDSAFLDDPQALHIATYHTMGGTDYDNVFAVGTVDGFIPRRDAFEVVSTDEERETIMNVERKLFYNGITKAKKRLVISSFSKAALDVAERTKMQVVRVKAEGESRMAIIRPSSFLSEAGDACPGMVGGQSVLAEYGLN